MRRSRLDNNNNNNRNRRIRVDKKRDIERIFFYRELDNCY